MEAAYGQALGYAKCFDQPPPFLIVCDIGHCFDLYCSFDGSTVYRPYNGTQGYRFYLSDLEKHADTLRRVMTAPLELDTSKQAAKITRKVAGHLADLAMALERAGHQSGAVATFLMRCIFTMFAEDVELLPAGIFTKAIEDRWIPHPDQFTKGVESLWQCMNEGSQFGFVGKLLRFNGGLFSDSKALPLDRNSLRILLDAAKCNWSEVEPAIFGTLLERAIDPKERHRLGAHYTPRAYVERLVRPTIEEPLRAEWDVVRAEVADLLSTEVREHVAFSVAEGADLTMIERKRIKRGNAGKKGAETNVLNRAREKVHAFHKRLCDTRVLDPACGTGNFLYVTLVIFRQLEDEVLRMLAVLGEPQEMLRADRIRVTPAQFLGIEVKRWAKEIAELVLWIGYLQAHFKTYGKGMPVPEPVLQDYKNIENRDAVLAWNEVRPRLDKLQRLVTRWDGETMKRSPVTGEFVPDESAQVPVMDYVNPRRAMWPEAQYIVGNPPFIGNKRMRLLLGDGYVEALRKAHDDVPETADLVMYWWNHAANLLKVDKRLRRFGLITTNSITQTFNRRVVQKHIDAKDGTSIVFAIPDHPWVDTESGAAVRIGMTVAAFGEDTGKLATVVSEQDGDDTGRNVSLVFADGDIHSDLTIGVDLTKLARLLSNRGIACPGVQLSGQGFVLSPEDADGFRAATKRDLVRPYLTGRDLSQTQREQYVIDTFGLSDDELRRSYPDAYQWLWDRVKPERAQNPRAKYAREWWLHSEPRSRFRGMLQVPRFIGTSRTARHRVFQFVDGRALPETKVLIIALQDGWHLGVLSSRVHVCFATAAGGWLGVGNDSTYNHSDCFNPFPFPDCSELQRRRIDKLGEELDGHRKRQQAAHPDVTITAMYNVLEKVRAGVALNEKEKLVHHRGLVSALQKIHDDLDAAVMDAYGWPRTLADEQILERIAALNATRSAEELGPGKRIRWLRADVQNPDEARTTQRRVIDVEDAEEVAPPSGPAVAWPKTLAEQITAVRDRLAASGRVWSVPEMATRFKKAPAEDVEAVLDALASLGLVVTYMAANGRRWMVPAPASSRMAA